MTVLHVGCKRSPRIRPSSRSERAMCAAGGHVKSTQARVSLGSSFSYLLFNIFIFENYLIYLYLKRTPPRLLCKAAGWAQWQQAFTVLQCQLT